MKKTITIVSSIIILAAICWGTYSYISNAKQKVFDSGAQIGLIYGNNKGVFAGFDSAIIQVIRGALMSGSVTLTYPDQDGNPQSITLIPLID